MTEENKNNKTIIEEICLAGGCNRGIAYIGCLKRMEELNILNLKKIVGTSIGSFIGACYILGYSSDELFDSIIEKNLNDFKDFSITEPSSLLKGEKYKNWIYEILAKKDNPNITLKELYNKTNIEFIITTTCIYNGSDDFSEGIVYLSHKITPDISLFNAINCSMAFPLVFPPVSYKNCEFIDGGMLDNFPLDLVSTNAIGIKTTSKPINSLTSIKNPISYIGKIFELMYNRLKLLKNETHQNIININCDDFDILDFDMSIDNKITLYKRGYYTTYNFFKNGMYIYINDKELSNKVLDNFNNSIYSVNSVKSANSDNSDNPDNFDKSDNFDNSDNSDSSDYSDDSDLNRTSDNIE